MIMLGNVVYSESVHVMFLISPMYISVGMETEKLIREVHAFQFILKFLKVKSTKFSIGTRSPEYGVGR